MDETEYCRRVSRVMLECLNDAHEANNQQLISMILTDMSSINNRPDRGENRRRGFVDMLSRLVNLQDIMNLPPEPFNLQDVAVPLPDFDELQTLTYSNNIESTRQALMCVICQEDFENGDELVKTRCSHMFHTQCARRHFQTSVNCPLCRADQRE